MSEVVSFTRSFVSIKAHYACLRLQLQSGFVLMRQLIVAAPCVCCCRCSRRYSTAAWHRCLFQFHLAALVIKSWTDTTHQITTVITSQLHCVHKTISLSETASPSPCLSSLLPLSFLTLICLARLPRLSGVSPVTNGFHFALIRSIILSTSCKIHQPRGRLLGL